MFLHLNHKNLDVYKVAEALTLECYRLTKHFPSEEKYGLVSQIRRAAISVMLNIAEGSSRKSETERKRYYEVSRGSVIEIDSAIGISVKLQFLKEEQLEKFKDSLIRTFQMLTRMIE